MLYHHNGKRYVAIKPNAQGLLALKELDLEMAILDGWVRYWHKGELLALPADLLRDVVAMKKDLDAMTRRAETAESELAELKEQVKKMRSKKNGAH
jgi:hypothetical protein